MILDFLKQVYRIWIYERPKQLAAALAYFAMFSLAPVIFVAITIAGKFVDNLALMERLFDTLEKILGTEMVQVIQDMIANATVDLPDTIEKWAWISSVIGFIALLWAASSLFTQIHFALNTVWRVPPGPAKQPRRKLRYRLLSFSMVILLGLLLVVVSIVNVIINWIDSFIEFEFNYTLILVVLFAGMTTLCFAFIYKLFPDVQLRWRHVWLGASIAGLLETIGFLLIGLFIHLGILSSASAAAGSFALLLLIAYYMAQIFLLGAVIIRVASGGPAEQAEA